MFQLKQTAIFVLSATAVFGLSACSSHGVGGSTESKNNLGSVSLDSLKVCAPERVFKDSILTFVPDPSPAANTGGKIQYDSRNNNARGGQFIAQCKNDKCFELQVYYVKNPVSKEDALDTLKQLLPADAPPQSKVDDTQLKAGAADPTETYFFGNAYRGEIHYADKTGTKVKLVNVVSVKDEAAKVANSSNEQNPSSTQ